MFIVALELKLTGWALLLVTACFLIMARSVLISIDVFLLMHLPGLQPWFARIGQLGEGGLYLLAIGLSQIISNMPATVLLLQKVPPSDVLAWAVNIGGFGLLPGSLANLIALRMALKSGGVSILFSLPILAWSMLCG